MLLSYKVISVPYFPVVDGELPNGVGYEDYYDKGNYQRVGVLGCESSLQPSFVTRPFSTYPEIQLKHSKGENQNPQKDDYRNGFDNRCQKKIGYVGELDDIAAEFSIEENTVDNSYTSDDEISQCYYHRRMISEKVSHRVSQ